MKPMIIESGNPHSLPLVYLRALASIAELATIA